MIVRILLLITITPSVIIAMQQEEDSISYRLVKIAYQATPLEDKKSYIRQVNVNGVKLKNDDCPRFVPVLNNKLYIQPSDHSGSKGTSVQTALKQLFETQQLDISGKRENIKIKPIFLHRNQQGFMVPGKYEEITIEDSNEQIQWTIVKISNQKRGLQLFNGIHIAYQQSAFIRAPEGHVFIEEISIRPLARERASDYLKLWLNYSSQALNLQTNTYLERLGSKLIASPFLDSQIQVTYIPNGSKMIPIPMAPESSQALARFEKTYFNGLPNEILDSIAKYIIYNSQTAEYIAQTNPALELKNNDKSIRSFEELAVEEIKQQSKPQTK